MRNLEINFTNHFQKLPEKIYKLIFYNFLMIDQKLESRKIVVLGTYCSGKTTLSEIISKRYNLTLSEDALKLEIDENFVGRNFNNLNNEEAMVISVRAFKRRKKFEMKNTSFVSDAGFISELAYYLSYINNEKNTSPSLVKNSLDYSQIYTEVFYLPMEIEFQQDNYRPNNLELRKNIDNKIREILKEKNINFKTISGNIPERINQIENYLEPKKG